MAEYFPEKIAQEVRLTFLDRVNLVMTERVNVTELLEDPSLPEDVVARAYRDLARTQCLLRNTAAIFRRLRKVPGPIRPAHGAATDRKRPCRINDTGRINPNGRLMN